MCMHQALSETVAFNLRFLEDLRQHLQYLTTKGYPVVLGSDLNIAPGHLDVHPSLLSPRYFTAEEIQAFSSLVDVPLIGIFRFVHPTDPVFTAFPLSIPLHTRQLHPF